MNNKILASLKVGDKVKVELKRKSQPVEGFVYSYSDTVLVLFKYADNEPSRNPSIPEKYNFNLIQLGSINNISQMSAWGKNSKKPAVSSIASLASLNLDKIIARESMAVRKFKEKLSRVGIGVSKEAQSIFDGLIRTLPCKWDKEVIEVMDGDVRINPPYTANDCSGRRQATLDHVIKAVSFNFLSFNIIL